MLESDTRGASVWGCQSPVNFAYLSHQLGLEGWAEAAQLGLGPDTLLFTSHSTPHHQEAQLGGRPAGETRSGGREGGGGGEGDGRGKKG